MPLLVQCFLFVSVTATFVNAMATIDVAHGLPHCPGDGNSTTVVVICEVNGLKEMNILRDDHNIAHWPANSVAGQVDTFTTNGDHTVKTVILSASNVTGNAFSALTMWQVEVGASGLGNATCRAEKEHDNRIFSTTWKSGSCKINGTITLSYGCYNNAGACIFSCRGDQMSLVSLNGQTLSGDVASITTNFRCYENNTCSSEVRDIVIINRGMAIGMASQLRVLRCTGLDGDIEVKISSTAAPVSTAPTQTAATKSGGGHTTGMNAAVMTIVAAVTVGGWI